jgi:hypothetical protein
VSPRRFAFRPQPSDRPSPGFSYGQPDGEIAVSDTRLTNDEARRISKLITRLPELVELEKDRNKNRCRRSLWRTYHVDGTGSARFNVLGM